MEKGPGIDPKRIVVIFLIAMAICLGIFLEKLLGLVFSYARWSDIAIFGEDWTLTTVIGYAIAAIAAVVTWRTPRTQTVSFEIAGELKKVTWPTLRETRAATAAVLIATFVAAALLGAFDAVWFWLSGKIY